MIIRTYACDNCDKEFEITCNSGDPDPDCPTCSIVLEWKPKSFNIATTKSKAINITQDILEKDFGLTNFRDNQRAGDVAGIVAPEPGQAAKDAEIRQLSEVVQQTTGQAMTDQQHTMAQAFWGGGTGVPAVAQERIAHGVSLAKESMADVNARGLNPMNLLHQAGKKGHLPDFKKNMQVVARVKS